MFREKDPYVVFEWSDPEDTGAKGWFVVNTLTGGACGGGTRMSPTVTRDEVISLAKTMEVKFHACGFGIGGAKSGICFDPADSRKLEVLKRFYQAIAPFLVTCYGTGGDLNVSFDEVSKFVLPHPQAGVVYALYKNEYVRERIEQLRKTNEGALSELNERFTYADMITGYGVAEATKAALQLLGEDVKDKRIGLQGFGIVGAAAAYYLAKSGAVIAGIMEADKTLTRDLTFGEVKQLFVDSIKRKSRLNHPDALPMEENRNNFLRKLQLDAFLPCAGSNLVTDAMMSTLLNCNTAENKKLIVVCGANNPFKEEETLYGSLSQKVDEDDRALLIPDFVANMGMARLFYTLMNAYNVEITPEYVFGDIKDTILTHFVDAPTVQFAKHSLERMLKEKEVLAT